MEDRELFETLKNHPNIEPDQAFLNKLRQNLQNNQGLKSKRITVATILTIPMTIAVFVFLLMITTGQSLEIKSAAAPIISQEKKLLFTGGLCVILSLLIFIIFVFSKGYTKGKLIYLAFALSLAVWLGNLMYANWLRVAEPIVVPSQSGISESSASRFLGGDSEVLLSFLNQEVKQLQEGNVDERSLR
jgi:hypothetical protein